MKTADLIPLILLELNSGNKYGLEITKSIEKRSGGKINIKQPTLYTVLKKLEKSSFITSYWLDSDIGGKRHYYKITENGKKQAATLPNYNTILNEILKTGDLEEETPKPETKSTIKNQQLSIEDNYRPNPKPKEQILPVQEVFDLDNIDNFTENDINKQNTKMLKTETFNKEDSFASNMKIKKFTEKQESKISEEYREQLRSIYENTNKKYADIDNQDSLNNYNSVKYVDYVDLKSKAEYIQSKKSIRNMWFRVLSTSLYLLLAICLTSISYKYAQDTSIFHISLIVSILCLIFYPAIFAFNYQKFQIACKDGKYKFNLKKQLYIATLILLIVILLSLLLNLTLGKLSVSGTFNIHNFANFYAPIIISTAAYADVLFGYVFMIKLSK